MADLMERYESRYGHAESGYLYTLGGDPAAIARHVEALEAEAQNSDVSMLGGFFGADPTPAETLHNEIIKDIERRYFAALSRDAALAICNALGDLGEFTPCATIQALRFNSFSFLAAWNDANPDKDPIRLNAAAYFSN